MRGGGERGWGGAILSDLVLGEVEVKEERGRWNKIGWGRWGAD